MTSDRVSPGGAERGPGRPARILRQAAAGDAERARKLLELVYAELHGLARRAMAEERKDHTLQPTALVNEVWLKLFERHARELQDRQHFLCVAARAMRQILVDHARSRGRGKRGGGRRVAMEVEPAVEDATAGFDLVALDAALDELRGHALRQAQIVEMRYFGGLSVEDTAAALGVSESTVAREWRFARAWLSSRIKGG